MSQFETSDFETNHVLPSVLSAAGETYIFSCLSRWCFRQTFRSFTSTFDLHDKRYQHGETFFFHYS
jgi:hypothetical protein